FLDDFEIGAARIGRRQLRAEHRTLGDDRLRPRIARPHHNHLSAAVAIAPEGDTGRVQQAQGPHEIHRIAVAPTLDPGVYLLPGLALTPPKIPVIVEERREA